MKIELPNRAQIEVKRAVVKLGTKQITDLVSINEKNISNLVAEVAVLRKQGIQFILTVSGAIGLGIYELYRDKSAIDNLTISQKQALAGLGQVKLMELFKAEFQKHGVHVGQVLLTHDIFDNRTTYLNARNTLISMLEMGLVPIINENDSVATDEIKIGDNDRLGAFVSLVAEADLYIMLSDIDGFYQDYNTDQRKFIPVVENVASVTKYACRQEEKFTKGGMITKLIAAKTTAISGIPAVIANGFKDSIITRVFNNLSEGTIFLPAPKSLNNKKRWITAKKPKGIIIIDAGAAKAVKGHKSLLSSGIKHVSGNFRYGDTISILDPDNSEIAIGLTNYSSDEISKIAGKKTSEAELILGRENCQSEVVHIDNMVLYDQ